MPLPAAVRIAVALRALGEDVTEVLDYVPASFRVIRKRPVETTLRGTVMM